MVTLGGVDVSIDGIKSIDVTRCVELTGVCSVQAHSLTVCFTLAAMPSLCHQPFYLSTSNPSRNEGTPFRSMDDYRPAYQETTTAP